MAENRWTPQVNAIVLKTLPRVSVCRKCKNKITNLGTRGPVRKICATCCAIAAKAERERHRKPRKFPSWTADEDAAILKFVPAIACKKINRSKAACSQRRFQLRHPVYLERAKQRLPYRGWQQHDVDRLRDKFMTVKRLPDLVAEFGGRFTLGQLLSKARTLKLKRKYEGNPRLTGHHELIDQICVRAKEDGIPIYKLDKICGMKSYFAYNGHRHRVNLRAVAKAVEFFGARLVIEWCDR